MEAFSLAEEHPPMAGLTISSKINLQTSVNNVTCFSLGKGTSISAEAYDRDVIYIGNGGSGDFAVGPEGEKRPAQREGRRPLQDSPAADTQVTTPRIRLNAQSSSVGCPLAMPPDRDCACPAGGCIISELRCNSSH